MGLATDQLKCPLCDHEYCVDYGRDARRFYRQCGRCHLVFVPPAFRLSTAAEKAYYDLHENHPGDPGYRRFLTRLFEPMCQRIAAPARGLDFGSGPGPTLSVMFAAAGYDMAIYDPYYAPDTHVLTGSYDFVTATEVVEHLDAPGLVLAQILGLVRSGGYLGLMTKLVISREAFARWHYKHDPTHICFFSRETFSWWARQVGCEVTFIGSDVILLLKP